MLNYLRAYYIFLITFCFSLCFGSSLSSQGLVINEIMSSNSTTIMDRDGDYEDWIELYNATDSAINLSGYFLSDDLSNPFRWSFPEVNIKPGDFLLVFASGKNKFDGRYYHTDFRIKKSGEPILLSNEEGNLIDYFAPVNLTTDNSFGRRRDGGAELVFFAGATPGKSNDLQPLYIDFHDKIFFSHEQGFYTNEFYLQVINLQSNTELRFTTNGSLPDKNSMLFPDSLLIYNRKNDPNHFSEIPTTPPEVPYPAVWMPPSEGIFKGNVIRIQAFQGEQAVSPVYTKTFFVHPQIFSRYNLPVISIITDSLNLFDHETGIYIPGIYYEENPDWSWVWGTGNYHQTGKDWERPVVVSFFEKDGKQAFHQNAGIRLHGSGSKALPQKSLRLYARNRYGQNTFDYKFFPEKDVKQFKRIILRNSGQDFYTTMLTDALTHRIVQDKMDLETQSVRPAVVFINGEFWGIHHIRDRVDKYYFEYCCGANPEKIDFLENRHSVKLGSNVDYIDMIEFIETHDMKFDQYYSQVAEQIDIINFIDLVIARQYFAVFDWPGNNMEYWRKQEPEAKWRWIFFDNDMSMTDYKFDAIEHSIIEGNDSWPNPDWSTFLLRNLLKNENFRTVYLERFEFHLINTFTENNIIKELNTLIDDIRPLMNEQINRWNYPRSYGEWMENINKIKKFAAMRPCYMLNLLVEHFNITDERYGGGICDDPEPDKILVVYPNPVVDEINVKIEDSRNIIKSVNIYDLSGRKVYGNEYPENSYIRELNLHLDQLGSGIYIISVQTDNYLLNKQFIKIM